MAGDKRERAKHARDKEASKVPNNPSQTSFSQVYQTFLDADSDGSGKLEVDEFIIAFLGVLKTEDGEDEEALAKLFCRWAREPDGKMRRACRTDARRER